MGRDGGDGIGCGVLSGHGLLESCLACALLLSPGIALAPLLLLHLSFGGRGAERMGTEGSGSSILGGGEACEDQGSHLLSELCLLLALQLLLHGLLLCLSLRALGLARLELGLHLSMGRRGSIECEGSGRAEEPCALAVTFASSLALSSLSCLSANAHASRLACRVSSMIWAARLSLAASYA